MLFLAPIAITRPLLTLVLVIEIGLWWVHNLVVYGEQTSSCYRVRVHKLDI